MSEAVADRDRPGTEPEAESGSGSGSEAGVGPTLGTVCWLLALAWGAAIASYPLTDNSFLTHLATGRLILEDGSVPSSDPYTFTAQGVDWTVQSWLPSILYAAAERAGGTVGLRIVVVALSMISAGLVWRLSAPCRSLVPRLAIVFGALYVVTDLWDERPFMVGVIGLGLVWLSLDGVGTPWMLAPMYWVWANSHGSFPLGVALTVLVLVGRRLDGEPVDRAIDVLKWSSIGVASAVVGPLGLRVLTFPATAVTKSEILREIVEWQPADFETMDQRLFLVFVAAALLGVVRRPSWGLALPTVAFVLFAVVAQRNIAMAMMVLVPVCAATAPALGTLTVDRRPALINGYVLVGVAAVVMSTVLALQSPFGSLRAYPQHPLAWQESLALGEINMAAPDIVGNLLTNLDGADARVFVDDRVDMLPEELVLDGIGLLRAEKDWPQTLDTYEVDWVLWNRLPLQQLVAHDPAWRVVFVDSEWALACRRGPGCEAAG